MQMFSTGLVAVLMVLLGLPVWAEKTVEGLPAANLTDAEPSGRELLKRFDETDPFLTAPIFDDPSAKALADVCYQVSRECLQFIRQNRVLAQWLLPNNPLYWQNYWVVMENFKPDFNPQEFVGGYPRDYVFQSLIEASWRWPLYQYATGGAIDVDDTLLFLRQSRRLLNESRFLLDGMIATALVGIGNSTAHHVLSQLGSHGDRSAFQQIEGLLREEKSRSLRGSFAGEFHIARALAQLNPDAVLDGLDENTTLDAFFSEYQLVVNLWSDVSERGFTAFWNQGVDVLASEAVQQTLFSFSEDSVFLPAHASYVITLHQIWVHSRVISALADIYAGRVAPGLPARPDPSPWQWDWRGNPDQLCLMPVAVHPSFNVEEVCVDYLGSPSG